MTAQQIPAYTQTHCEWPSHDRPANPRIHTRTLGVTTNTLWMTWYACRHIVNDHHKTTQQAPANTLWMTITWPPNKPLHTVNDHHMTAQQTPVYKQAHWEWPSHDRPANSCIHAHTLWITNLLPKVTWLTPNLKAWSRMPPHEMNALKSIFEKPCSQSIYTVKRQFCSEVYSWHQTSKLELWIDATAIMGPPSNVLEKRCGRTWGWGGGRCLERKVRERERGCSKRERDRQAKKRHLQTHTEKERHRKTKRHSLSHTHTYPPHKPICWQFTVNCSTLSILRVRPRLTWSWWHFNGFD